MVPNIIIVDISKFKRKILCSEPEKTNLKRSFNSIKRDKKITVSLARI